MRDRPEHKTTRCAIYTRKSTEEGLQQEFNSLDAQREACAAFILSQRHEGWSAVPGVYDDGGCSGGNMDRPALKMLLADVAAGKVDVIVVYKVDRLTRSLADFAKIVEILDKADASFVSVTQSFNTTTSMGRLTLNVLLSFAQFEREVTGECIRDKIAASKAKGMWMGGPVPLGYHLADRQLIINTAEAETVRSIFGRYIELGSGRELLAELDATGVRSKPRTNRHGKAYGARPVSRGALYAMLQNRLYVGDVSHKGQVYRGRHEAIIEREVFDRVQSLLEQGRVDRRLGTNAREVSLLAGLVFDSLGRRMSPSHAAKQVRRYRYYVSQNDGETSRDTTCWRISAPDIEARVTASISEVVDQQCRTATSTGLLSADETVRLHENASGLVARLRQAHGSEIRDIVLKLVRRIDVSETFVTMQIDLGHVDPVLGDIGPQSAQFPTVGVRSAKNLRLVVPPTYTQGEAKRDPALVKLVVQAMALRSRVAQQSAENFRELAGTLGLSREYAADLLRISYLAPDIIAAIVDGRHPASLTRTRLIKSPNLPLDWASQREALGLA